MGAFTPQLPPGPSESVEQLASNKPSRATARRVFIPSNRQTASGRRHADWIVSVPRPLRSFPKCPARPGAAPWATSGCPAQARARAWRGRSRWPPSAGTPAGGSWRRACALRHSWKATPVPTEQRGALAPRSACACRYVAFWAGVSLANICWSPSLLPVKCSGSTAPAPPLCSPSALAILGRDLPSWRSCRISPSAVERS